jgi:hypothetical protein
MTRVEEWRDIAGFEGRYQVSSFGRVRSFVQDKTSGRLLKAQAFSNHYLFVQLGSNGGTHLIHRLVAEAFVSGDTSLQVNHKDGVRTNNCVDNLEWLSCSDNHRHSYRELTRKRHALSRPVVLVRRGEEVHLSSLKDAVRYLSSDVGTISKTMRRGHRCRGYEVHDAI